MAFIKKTKSGQKIVVRTPYEKTERFQKQLKTGKVSETGNRLTKEDRAYRKGYVNARKETFKQRARSKQTAQKSKAAKR